MSIDFKKTLANMLERKYNKALEQQSKQIDALVEVLIAADMLKDCMNEDRWDGVDYYVASIKASLDEYDNAVDAEGLEWERYEKVKRLCLKRGVEL